MVSVIVSPDSKQMYIMTSPWLVLGLEDKTSTLNLKSKCVHRQENNILICSALVADSV